MNTFIPLCLLMSCSAGMWACCDDIFVTLYFYSNVLLLYTVVLLQLSMAEISEATD